MYVNNYRPISLSSPVLKIFMVLLKNKCYKQLDSYQKVEQAGFRKGFSTMDYIQTINQLLEKSKEFYLDLASMFKDYNQTYDSLHHEKIWKSLAKKNIPEVIQMPSIIY